MSANEDHFRKYCSQCSLRDRDKANNRLKRIRAYAQENSGRKAIRFGQKISGQLPGNFCDAIGSAWTDRSNRSTVHGGMHYDGSARGLGQEEEAQKQNRAGLLGHRNESGS